MATNVIPLRPQLSDPVVLPRNIEAEQAVIGSALVNNAVLDRCQWLSPADFFEPVHGRIWTAMLDELRDGRRADAILLKRLFDDDPALSELDGAKYLVRLGRCAAAIAEAVDYASHVRRLARLRAMWAIADQLREMAMSPGEGEDAATILGKHIGELEACARDDSRPLAKHVSEVVDELVLQIDHPPAMWRTGIPALDESLGGGVREGYVIGFEARAKSFKTGCMHTALLALARQRVPACYMALEMGSARLAQRMLGHVGGFNSGMFRHVDGHLRHRVEQARGELDAIPLWFVDCPGVRFSRLKSQVSQCVLAHGIKVFVLDYWQLVNPDQPTRNKADFLAEVAQWCADHAHEFGTTWLIASQENRAGESYGSDGLVKACDWLSVLHKHDVKFILPTGPVETLWMDVKYARDSAGDSIGSEMSPMLYINPNGPHLAQLP